MDYKEDASMIASSEKIFDDHALELSQQAITEYLEIVGYKITKLDNVKTTGATDCVYIILEIDNRNKRFIKVGEKVDKELENIIRLRNLGVQSIPPVFEGSHSHKRILITDLLPYPNAGYEAIQDLYEGKVSAIEFLSFQNKVFGALNEFYQIPVDSKEGYRSQMFEVRTSERMSALLSDKSFAISACFLDGQDGVTLDTILNTPIVYNKGKLAFNLPSIVEMHDEFVNIMRTISQIQPKVVHGDFHAPNISITEDKKIRIIDISDVRFGEDPTWDLGKWLNYLQRFYRAADIRSGNTPDHSILFSLDGREIILYENIDIDSVQLGIDNIRQRAVDNFSSMVHEDRGIIDLRATAAEFVVNISTLRRHAKNYTQTVKNVLVYLCDSYIQLQKKNTMNVHYLQFNQLTRTQIWEYFNKKGYQNDRPLLLSFDVDKTIVDRARGAHFMSEKVKRMFQKLEENKNFIFTMNTGRDATNYLPIQDQTDHREPNIFVSGRVIRHKGKIYTDPQAVFSDGLKNNLWDQFIKDAIPFLDVKHSNGNTFFVKGSRSLEKYYGHHRPVDWFDALPFEIIDIDTEKTAQEKFNNLEVVRVEVPLLYRNEPVEILEAINKEDAKNAQRIAEERLKITNGLDLLFVPAPAHTTRGEQMKTEIGSIRIVVHDKYVNKGTGLKYLAELLKIPEQNIICFGDSAEDKANDAIIKKVLPKATLIITGNGEREAKWFADFVVEPVGRDGVPKAVGRLIAFQKRYSL